MRILKAIISIFIGIPFMISTSVWWIEFIATHKPIFTCEWLAMFFWTIHWFVWFTISIGGSALILFWGVCDEQI